MSAIDALTPRDLLLLVILFTLFGAGLGLVLGHAIATLTLRLAPNRPERPSSIPRRRP